MKSAGQCLRGTQRQTALHMLADIVDGALASVCSILLGRVLRTFLTGMRRIIKQPLKFVKSR